MNVLTALWVGLLIGLLPCRLIAQSTLLPDSLAQAPDTTKAWTLREIGNSLIEKGNFTLAKQALDEGLVRAQATRKPGEVGLAYRALGYWYKTVGDYPQALSYYQRGIEQFRKGGHQKQVVKNLRFISLCYERLKNDKLARFYTEQAMQLARKEGFDDLLTQSYEEMAILESHQKRFREALAYTQKVLDYYKQKKDWQSYYTALFNAGLHYKNKGDYKRSEDAFRQVLAYAQAQHDEYMKGFVAASIPYALIPQNRLDEAEKFCRQGMVWLETMGAEKQSLREEFYGHLSAIAEKRGDFKQALTYYKRQIANHDSVVNATRNQQVAELETRYQTREKEESIRQLAETNNRQNRQIWAGVSGLIVLTLLLALLYGLYTRVRQSRRKIQHQSDQMALLMKELHHRVKNNLAIVSSLLRLQSNRLDDEKAVQAVRVGQQRVEAMALIHQRLYQTEQVTRVNMREYLTDLAESLMRAYGYEGEEFDLLLNIELQELDVDVAMPLGLIVNELVTNSFKYAYTDGQRPLLRISLRQDSGALHPGITLEVQDNGPGIEVADWQRSGSRASFGKRLIASLSDQLEAQFELLKQNGTLFRLHIPEARLEARLQA